MTGDERQRLVTENMALAGYMANKLWARGGAYRLLPGLADVRQECYAALLFAAETFRPDLGKPFHNWACRVMVSHVWRAAVEYGAVPRVPWQWLRREPPAHCRPFVDQAMRTIRMPENADAETWEPAAPADEEAAGAEELEALGRALAALPPRWARVIRRRFGLDGPARNQAEIGRLLGCTQMRVSDIQRRAMARLRRLLGAPEPVGRQRRHVVGGRAARGAA